MKENGWRFGGFPKNSEVCRRLPNIYHTYLRVQSPESRVQSPESRVQSPVQSPALVLDYAGKCRRRRHLSFRPCSKATGSVINRLWVITKQLEISTFQLGLNVHVRPPRRLNVNTSQTQTRLYFSNKRNLTMKTSENEQGTRNKEQGTKTKHCYNNNLAHHYRTYFMSTLIRLKTICINNHIRFT